MAERTIRTCDVCDEEIPRRKRGWNIGQEQGQWSYFVTVRVTRWWHRTPEEKADIDHVCEECWDAMVAEAREIRKRVRDDGR